MANARDDGSHAEGTSGATTGITLRISRDRGFSWYVHSVQPLGAQGKYNNRPTFNRCGYGFDTVVELSWAGPMRSALNGVFIITENHEADQ